MDGGRITIISLNIDDELLENLKIRAIEMESDYSDLIGEYIQRGLNGRVKMTININESVMEKVNIMAKLTDRTAEEVINDTLWDNLRRIIDVPDEIDGDEIWNMLDHDKPEGDDILDNLSRLGNKGWD